MTITQRLRRQRHLRAVFRRVGVRAGPNLPERPLSSPQLYTWNTLYTIQWAPTRQRGPSALHIYNTKQVRTKALHTNTCNTFLQSTEPQLSVEAPQLSTVKTLHSYYWTEQQCSACLHPFALDGWMESGSLTRSLLTIK